MMKFKIQMLILRILREYSFFLIIPKTSFSVSGYFIISYYHLLTTLSKYVAHLVDIELSEKTMHFSYQ